MNGLQLPMEMDLLNAANAKAQEVATNIFLKTAVNTHRNKGFFEEMTNELAEIFESFTEENMAVSKTVCSKLLEELYAPIDERVGRGEFTKAGGSQAYKDEVYVLSDYLSSIFLFLFLHHHSPGGKDGARVHDGAAQSKGTLWGDRSACFQKAEGKFEH